MKLIGRKVRITKGLYMGTVGTITGLTDNQTHFSIRIKNGIITLPRPNRPNAGCEFVLKTNTTFAKKKAKIEPKTIVLGSQKAMVVFGKNDITVKRHGITRGTIIFEHLNKVVEKIRTFRDTLSGTILGNWHMYMDEDVRCYRIGCGIENNLFSLQELETAVATYKRVNKIK